MKKVLIPLLILFVVALSGCSSPTAQTSDSKEIYQGLGKAVNFRVGPGEDSEKVPVYCFNIVLADASFDNEGRIINSYFDIYEVSTPNYDGASMPHFTGWPGTDGYNLTDHTTGKVTGIAKNDEASAAEEVNNWKSKRERGDAYGMNPKNEWYKQMDAYQEFFKGKTVDEIEAWVKKYTSDRNARPLKPDSTNEEDAAKYNALTEDEKKEVADVVSSATMSLNDSHGYIVKALRNAYESKVKLTID